MSGRINNYPIEGEGALTIEELTRQRPDDHGKGRKCPGCGKTINRYNPNTHCYQCNERNPNDHRKRRKLSGPRN